jgi:hypothetical protein
LLHLTGKRIEELQQDHQKERKKMIKRMISPVPVSFSIQITRMHAGADAMLADHFGF